MIRVKDIRKTYHDKVILDGVTFSAKQGEIIGIFGPSGEGKTTLLHILMGLIRFDSGSVTGISGKQAAVFQEDRLLENFNAVQNISFVTECSIDRIHNELLSVIPDLDMQKKVGQMSGGMKRRLCIVRALITDADFIYMDEPFKGLDEKNKERTIQYVLNHKNERTIFIVTHDKTELDRMGVNKIIRLKEK